MSQGQSLNGALADLEGPFRSAGNNMIVTVVSAEQKARESVSEMSDRQTL